MATKTFSKNVIKEGGDYTINNAFLNTLTDNKKTINTTNFSPLIQQIGTTEILLNEKLQKSVNETLSNLQALITLENAGFILSFSKYFKKYDANGNLVKSIKYNGYKRQIYF